jgi:ribosomal protein S18 acetylase RimI-like enzyme
MSMGDLGWSTDLLTDAFEGLPPATHMFHGAKARKKLAYFMRCGARYALLYGECHATEEQDAAALWLVPGATHMTPGRMFRAGMFAAPLRFGPSDLKAFGSFVKHTDEVHREVAPDPHYYLLTLGVAPKAQGNGAGGRLLRSMLERCDAEGMPAYLETQRPENVPIYERFGFKTASETSIPDIGLRNWGMIRAPA